MKGAETIVAHDAMQAFMSAMRSPASFKALGATEFLRKPVDPEELYRVLCTLLAPQERAG